jgi:hypothetical protein
VKAVTWPNTIINLQVFQKISDVFTVCAQNHENITAASFYGVLIIWGKYFWILHFVES